MYTKRIDHQTRCNQNNFLFRLKSVGVFRVTELNKFTLSTNVIMERVWDAKHSRPQSSVLSGIDWQWAERQEFDFCQPQSGLACAEHSILFQS